MYRCWLLSLCSCLSQEGLKQPAQEQAEGSDLDEDGYTEEDGDCDDSNGQIHPQASEITEDGIDQDCDGFDLHSCTDDINYSAQIVEGWRVCLANSLSDQAPDLYAAVFSLLSEDLFFISTLIEAEPLAFLQTVRIWVEHNHDDFPGGVYHPSAEWLVQHGYPEHWAHSIQLGNAENYLSWTSIQPAMVLHELSHAWHHQRLGYDNQEIINAYNAAVESGTYESVEYAGGGTQRAYALSNEMEYFAELTEALLWENDFYPFVREELFSFDPVGAAVVDAAWMQ